MIDDRVSPAVSFEPSALPVWIGAAELARLAGIAEQNARSALAACAKGATWRQYPLQVRTKAGGPASARNPYLVHVASLPPALSEKYMERAVAAHPPVPVKLGDMPAMPTRVDLKAAKKEAELRWKLQILGPAMEYHEGSSARAETLRGIAARKHIGLDGKTKRISLRTLQGWITRIKKAESVDGLLRKDRADRPDRNLISRAWDKACPLPDGVKQGIACEIETYVRSLWAQGVPGWKVCEEYASSKLAELSRAAGWGDASYDLCRVGRYYVEKHSETKLIAIKEKDAKRWFDRFVPRAKRTREGLRPGDIVVGDVHPVDILVKRDDGTEATHRLIAWYDVATGDLFATLVLYAAGESVTQADIAASFAAMVEAWGLPRLLMLDNGSEYSWKELERGFAELANLSRAMNLAFAILPRDDEDAVPFMEDEEDEIAARPSPILRALPHRPCSKPIEGIFAALEQTVLSQFPGWIGGDRMNKRTHKMGKAPKAFPGTLEQFERAFMVALRYWRSRPRRYLGYKSPDQVRHAFQTDGGPLPPSVPHEALVFALAEERTAKVATGGIAAGGGWYQSPEIIKRVGQTVLIRYAKWAPEFIFAIDEQRRPLRVDRRPVYGYADGEGARHQARMNGVLNARIRELKAGTRKVDLLAEMSRHVAASGQPVAVLKGPEILLSDELEAARSAASLPAPDDEPKELGYGEIVDRKTGQIVSTIPDHYSNRHSQAEDDEDEDETNWAALAAHFTTKEGLDVAATSPSPDEAFRKSGTDR